MPRLREPQAPTAQHKPVRKAMPKRKNAAPPKSQPRRNVPPVTTRKSTDAAEHAESSGVATMQQSRAGDPEIKITEPQLVEPVARISKEKMELLAFMKEKVTVQIDESSDAQADPSFTVSVNGRNQIFVRGREYNVPRYIVEGLARAKPVGFRNEEFTQNDGVRAVRWPSKRGLRYPFRVIKDSDRGHAWLRQVLKQP